MQQYLYLYYMLYNSSIVESEKEKNVLVHLLVLAAKCFPPLSFLELNEGFGGYEEKMDPIVVGNFLLNLLTELLFLNNT